METLNIILTILTLPINVIGGWVVGTWIGERLVRYLEARRGR